jgi:hypothetical protein
MQRARALTSGRFHIDASATTTTSDTLAVESVSTNDSTYVIVSTEGNDHLRCVAFHWLKEGDLVVARLREGVCGAKVKLLLCPLDNCT